MILMSLSFIIVGLCSSYKIKLLGVAFASLQSGLGEGSMLALAGLHEDPVLCLTAWSSGTGAAGIFGEETLVVLRLITNASIKL